MTKNILVLFVAIILSGVDAFGNADNLLPPESIAMKVASASSTPTLLPQRAPVYDADGFRVVKVGLYENKPKIFTDEKGSPAGIFVSILNEIARREKWHLIYSSGDWSQCLASLESGDLDLMPDVAYSQDRDDKFDFHREGVVNSWAEVYSVESKRIASLQGLNGLKIAVLKGSIQKELFEEMMKGFGYSATLVEVDSSTDELTLAMDKKVDALIVNRFFGDYYCHRFGLKITPIIFAPVVLYYATLAGQNGDLLQAIDENLREMKTESGSVYYQTLERWMADPPQTVFPAYLKWFFWGVSLLLLVAFVFIVLLRWRVGVVARSLERTNERLRRSEKKFHDIFNKHAAVKMILNPDTGEIVEVNEAAEKFYGWTAAELCRKRIQEINTLSPAEVKAEMAQAMRQERIHFEFRHRLASGDIREVAVFCSPVDIDGVPMLYSVIHDITARKQAESDMERLKEQVSQSQKMESIGRLAGGVAHEFNNMLGVIVGYAELALEKVPEASPLYGDLNEILKAANRSASITMQLLAFARKQVVSPVVLDLNVSVDGMRDVLTSLLGANTVLDWKPGRNLWPVKIDPIQVSQVMACLCSNARDAIPDKGSVTLETKNVSFDLGYCQKHPEFSLGEYVMLSVTDTGRGMDAETLKNIFEPFFTTKGICKSAGLGLPTVYGIVKQNNGFIDICSELGQGTTFKMFFPRSMKSVDQASDGEAGDGIPRGAGQSILVVEDGEAIRELGKKLLERLGYKVSTANTPAEAIRLVRDHRGRFDLVLSDLVLPEMSGWEVTDKITEIDPRIRIVYMSGYSEGLIASRRVDDPGINFLQKPFSTKDLAIAISRALGRD